MDVKINILGREYSICHVHESRDKKLETMDGYADFTTKKLVVAIREPCNVRASRGRCRTPSRGAWIKIIVLCVDSDEKLT